MAVYSVYKCGRGAHNITFRAAGWRPVIKLHVVGVLIDKVVLHIISMYFSRYSRHWRNFVNGAKMPVILWCFLWSLTVRIIYTISSWSKFGKKKNCTFGTVHISVHPFF